jgi:hypothetical protein
MRATGGYAKSSHAASREFIHLCFQLRRTGVNHGYSTKHFGLAADYIEHVRIIESVVPHLDKHDSEQAVAGRIPQQVLRQVRGARHIRGLKARRQRIFADVVRPQMDMGVNQIFSPHGFGVHLR